MFIYICVILLICDRMEMLILIWMSLGSIKHFCDLGYTDGKTSVT